MPFCGGDGYTSFSDCYFSNNYDATGYSIVAEARKLQVQNCTLDALSKERKPGKAWTGADRRYQPPAIQLKRGVRHAIIRGNNGYYGVQIENGIGDRAIISDNEPYRPVP
jgi:hypothetical protein